MASAQKIGSEVESNESPLGKLSVKSENGSKAPRMSHKLLGSTSLSNAQNASMSDAQKSWYGIAGPIPERFFPVDPSYQKRRVKRSHEQLKILKTNQAKLDHDPNLRHIQIGVEDPTEIPDEGAIIVTGTAMEVKLPPSALVDMTLPRVDGEKYCDLDLPSGALFKSKGWFILPAGTRVEKVTFSKPSPAKLIGSEIVELPWGITGEKQKVSAVTLLPDDLRKTDDELVRVSILMPQNDLTLMSLNPGDLIRFSKREEHRVKNPKNDEKNSIQITPSDRISPELMGASTDVGELGRKKSPQDLGYVKDHSESRIFDPKIEGEPGSYWLYTTK